MRAWIETPCRLLFALILVAASSSANACCIGIYYAIDSKTAESLRDQPDAQVLAQISTISERVSGNDKLDVDESWDAMHRALARGKLAPPDGSPTGYVVLGGQSLLETDDWIAVLITPRQARLASHSIQNISRQEFRQRYDRIDADSYDVPLSDDDFAYTWDNFVNVRQAFARWTREGKWILFVAAQ
jgi:uncharacterized protein DUF1877